MSDSKDISRREFARRVAMASAGVSAAAVAPVGVLAGTALPELAQAPGGPALSDAEKAEAASRVDAILKLYGERFSDAQKADLQRLSVLAQGQLDHVRAYAVENGDGEALYLKPLMEREKKK